VAKGGAEEEFLSLEDDIEVIAKKPFRLKVMRSKPKITAELEPIEEDKPVIEAIEVEEIIAAHAGIHVMSWPLSGMDCPDCAMKAEKALGRLKQVNSCNVSAIDGTVEVEVDFEKGPVANVGNVLKSLGNPADLPYVQILGVRASNLAQRHGLDRKSLPRLIKRQPGILEVEITEDDRIIMQMVSESDSDLIKARNVALEELIGTQLRLGVATSSRITSDQWRLIGAGVAIPVFILIVMMDLLSVSTTIRAAVGITGVLIGGLKMFSEAWASIRSGQLGYKVLTSLAVIGASILGAWQEALLVIILVAFAEHMEGRALIRARKAMQGGLDRIPRFARRLSKPAVPVGIKLVMAGSNDNLSPASHTMAEVEEIPIELVQLGDLLEIRTGGLIPADGRIVNGSGSVDRAPLTGESIPSAVGKGDELHAGLILTSGPVTIEVEAVREATRLHGLIDSVHSFRDKPPRLQSSIEIFIAIWVPLVMVGAVLIWILFMEPSEWKVILLLWVVACPCALLLAAPIPHAAALSQAVHKGGIARGGDVLESLSKVNLALLDKTGTLTSGRPRLGVIHLAKGGKRDAALRLAAGLEKSSNHPYANIITKSCESDGLSPLKVSALADIGGGVEGKIDGKQAVIIKASPELLSGNLLKKFKESLAAGHGSSLLIKEDKPVALFTFIHDDIRVGAKELITNLYDSDVNVEILSGDHQGAVDIFAGTLGVDSRVAHGDMTPEDKVRWVGGRSKTHITMMVGDGFNDAAAMAAADIGVAIGSGESTNLDAADLLIPGDDPRLLAEMIGLSRKTRRILLQNLFLSVSVTLILVWSVLMGINDNLVIGVLIHELSVILVIFNGARLAGDEGIGRLLKETVKDLFRETREAFSKLFEKISVKS